MINPSSPAPWRGMALLGRKIRDVLTSWALDAISPPALVLFAPYGLAAMVALAGALA